MDIKKLKASSLIEEVIPETTGYLLTGTGEMKICAGAPGLQVDIKKQRYTWPEQGENGDVFLWLQKRFHWNFRKSVMYLANRQEMAPEMRVQPNMSATKELRETASRVPDQVMNSKGVEDWRVKKARKISEDFPIEIDLVLRWGLSYLEDKCRGLPSMFVMIVGDVEELEFCTWCYCEFTHKTKGAFKAVKVHDNMDLYFKNRGVYCEKCVEKFMRWKQSINLLSEYLLEELFADRVSD